MRVIILMNVKLSYKKIIRVVSMKNVSRAQIDFAQYCTRENALARRYRDRGRDTTKLLVDFKEVDRQIVREGVLIGYGEHENTFQPIISAHY